jgi:hypothetical protein
MFDPDLCRMNWPWLHGKVPRKWHQEEHPLEGPEEQSAAGGGTPDGEGE